MLPSLDDFLNTADSRLFKNSYVMEPGFNSLYVRISSRRIPEHNKFVRFLDIAQIHATHPGQGNFTKLVTRLHPDYNVYVESVLNFSFEKKLLRMGFTQEPNRIPPSFYLLKTDTLQV